MPRHFCLCQVMRPLPIRVRTEGGVWRAGGLTGPRQVHVAGHIARDAEATPVAAGELAGQVAQALRNTATGLVGAGAGFADVVRLRFYVTHWSPEKIEDFVAGIERVADEPDLPRPLPPASLIVVEYLFDPTSSWRSRRPPSWTDRTQPPPGSHAHTGQVRRAMVERDTSKTDGWKVLG